MSTQRQRWMLSVLPILALLAPSVPASLAQPVAAITATPPSAQVMTTDSQIGAAAVRQGPLKTPADHRWQPNVPVYPLLPDCTNQENPDIAVDAAENIYLLWNDYRDGSSDIHFAYRPAVGAWSSNTRVDDVAGTVDGAPKIAVDATGNAYALWEDQRHGDAGIYFSYRSDGGSWQTPQRLQEPGIQGDRFSPAIAVDPEGNAYVVWTDRRDQEGDIYFAYRPAGGSWNASEPLRVPSGWGDLPESSPDIAVDASGNAYVVWDAYWSGYVDNFLFFSQRTPSSAWSEPEELLGGGEENWRAAIAANETGTIIVLALGLVGLGYRYRPAGDAWTRFQLIAGVYYLIADYDIALDGAGDAYAVITRGDYPSGENGEIFFTRKPVGGAWSPVERILDAPDSWEESASIEVDAAGNAYATWAYRADHATDVFFAYRPAGRPWREAIRINDDSGAAPQWRSAIGVDPAGDAQALWLDKRASTAQLFAAYARHDDLAGPLTPNGSGTARPRTFPAPAVCSAARTAAPRPAITSSIPMRILAAPSP